MCPECRLPPGCPGPGRTRPPHLYNNQSTPRAPWVGLPTTCLEEPEVNIGSGKSSNGYRAPEPSCLVKYGIGQRLLIVELMLGATRPHLGPYLGQWTQDQSAHFFDNPRPIQAPLAGRVTLPHLDIIGWTSIDKHGVVRWSTFTLQKHNLCPDLGSRLLSGAMAVLAKLRQSWIFLGNKFCFWGILHVIDHASSALLYALAIDAEMFLCLKTPFYNFFLKWKLHTFFEKCSLNIEKRRKFSRLVQWDFNTWLPKGRQWGG